LEFDLTGVGERDCNDEHALVRTGIDPNHVVERGIRRPESLSIPSLICGAYYDGIYVWGAASDHRFGQLVIGHSRLD
jgi:hypothetical protein